MKHFWTAFVILLLCAGAHVGIVKAQAEAVRARATVVAFEIPDRIGRYRQYGQDIDAGDHTRRVLETSSILMRNYVAPNGWPVQLTIVYAGTTRRSLHFPEVCLVGAGWEIMEQRAAPVGVAFEAKRLVLVNGARREAVLYWFKTGDKLTGNYFLNAYHWAKNQLMFGAPTSAMIKLTAPVQGGNSEMAFSILEDFAASFAPILLDRVR